MHTRIEIHTGPTNESASPTYVVTDATIINAMVAAARTEVDGLTADPNKFTAHNQGLTKVEDHLAG